MDANSVVGLAITDDQLDLLCGGYCELKRNSYSLVCKELADDPSDDFNLMPLVLNELCTPCGRALIVPLLKRLMQPYFNGANEGMTSHEGMSMTEHLHAGLCVQVSDPCRAGHD